MTDLKDTLNNSLPEQVRIRYEEINPDSRINHRGIDV